MKYQLFYEDKKIKWKTIEKFMNATMSLEKIKHYPVMLNQVLSTISPQRGGTYIDCTFGAGGYSEEILKFSNTKVIALDRDKLSESYANTLLEKFPKRFNFYKDKFSNINKLIEKKLNPQAIIFDLGLSSLQLSDTKRGFSFESENFLNMEMGINDCLTYDVINSLDREHLGSIIKILGEEKEGKRIANEIDRHRKRKPIQNSKELALIVKKAKRKNINYKKNPATKTFQAIRIFVNKELTELISGLIGATKLLSNGGMLIVVSFHSIEDRIVKNFFNFHSSIKSNPSRYLPVKENKSNLFKKVCKKALLPTSGEINENPRSRSAKLRYAVRNDNSFRNPEEFKKMFLNYFELESVPT